jgi:hypothetical protein
MKHPVAAGCALHLLLVISLPNEASGDVVTTWNKNAADAATAACLHISGNALAESRMYAMVHAAIHDAMNAIDRRSRPYAYDAAAPVPSSVDAAVAAAARDVLVAVIPTLPESASCVDAGVSSANNSYLTALAAIGNGPAKSNGIALGQAAAAAILARRANDGSDIVWFDPNYPQGTAPGEWRFTPDFPFQIAFAPDWGKVTPFVLQHAAQYRASRPHQLRSRGYAADFNEIKVLGGDDITTPSTRTAEQTQIGLFWIESSPLAWNRLARDVTATSGFDSWENARLFGLLNLALADGYISSWEAKYHHKFWRPITAIRNGDTDGNPDTVGEADWTPLQPTYPMPDHDSAHAVEGGAAAEVLKLVFGTDDIPFTACSTTLPATDICTDPTPVLRSYSSFSEAADENAVSRIYVGIHFRHAVEEGVKHGRKIGKRAVNLFMRPVR